VQRQLAERVKQEVEREMAEVLPKLAAAVRLMAPASLPNSALVLALSSLVLPRRCRCL